MATEYEPAEIESKWQAYWEKNDLFVASQASSSPKMYVLDMFPYPSGEGLHVGHTKIYTASDIVSRYLRMNGYNVMHPTGWDAFGLPTENTAIKTGIHPAELTKRNTDRFRKQMKRLGLSYDWTREVNTSDPEYYKWTQWIFLQLYKMGLAYEATVPINWCPSCQTGLANEEVLDGRCERCDTAVVQKPLKQWMLKITRYSDKLLQGIGGLDWPQSIKDMQENWIGKSQGAKIKFEIESLVGEFIEVFTTRPDILFGVSYVTIAPEHVLVDQLTTSDRRAEVDAYRVTAKRKTHKERTDETRDKTGVFTGSYAFHPITKQKIPIWIADYVVADYGTGAVMGVPAHDERDFAFAKKFELSIIAVIEPSEVHQGDKLPYLGEGVLVNSGEHDGQSTQDARRLIIDRLRLSGHGQPSTTYRLRDWVFSRQRYWGEPIPLIHCEKCGVVPVPEDELPVTLPETQTYQPAGDGQSPLAQIDEWVNVKCPTCPGQAKREVNTMPQWAGSSWYFLRFTDPNRQESFADPEKMRKWLPVDIYIGGAEHAVLHLLYARFWMHALFEGGNVPYNEPFARLRNVGLVLGEDGQKMSKSRGNVVNPDDEVDRFGADTTRLFAMFMGPFDGKGQWSTTGIIGVHRFVRRLWSTMLRFYEAGFASKETDEISLGLQHAIVRIAAGTEQFKFNTSVAAMMEFLNLIESCEQISENTFRTYLILIAPYAPHLAEELWHRAGYDDSVTSQSWPAANTALLSQADVTIAVQVNGKLRGELQAPAKAKEDYVKELALALSNVKKFTEGKEVVKVIVIPDRLINFVVT